jgi:hypothetical protein
MSKERAARIANSPGASSRGGKASGSGIRRNDATQGGTTAQKRAAGRKGGRATAPNNSPKTPGGPSAAAPRHRAG